MTDDKDISKLAAAMGRRGGLARTAKKTAASRANAINARAAITPERQIESAKAANAKRWEVKVTDDVELGRKLWGDAPLPQVIPIVGTVERDRKVGALLKIPGGAWAMGIDGNIKALSTDKVKAAMEKRL
jgi:hypothetical protein